MQTEMMGGEVSTHPLQGTSKKLSTGKRWWYDLARCGDETSVNPQTSQSVGNSHIFDEHLGHM